MIPNYTLRLEPVDVEAHLLIRSMNETHIKSASWMHVGCALILHRSSLLSHQIRMLTYSEFEQVLNRVLSDIQEQLAAERLIEQSEVP